MKRKTVFWVLIITLCLAVLCLTACENDKNDENSGSKSPDIRKEAEKSFEETKDEINEMEISVFNNTYKMYEGQQLGSNAKSLVDMIKINNQTMKEHIVEVEYIDQNGNSTKYVEEEEFSSLKAIISASHSYKITTETGENGFINNILIKY